jgi:hypothetical protein
MDRVNITSTPIAGSLPAQKPILAIALRFLANDFAAAGLLFLAGLLTRLPFRSAILYHWDSVNFSFALQEFNIAKEQPQPPGYLLYVGLAKAVDLLYHNPQTTMVTISIVSSALAAAALFFLGRAMFGREAGLVAALLLIFSPLFWFYGEIALPHALDALLVIVSVWFLFETMRGKPSYFVPAILAVSISGGVRQQTLVFLFPVLLFALRKVGWRRWLLGGLLGGALCLAWFIPLIAWSGGLSHYLAVMNAFTDRFQSTTSIFMGAGWIGLRRNLIKLTLYTAYGWGFAVLPALLAGWTGLRRGGWLKTVSERSLFLGLWIAPAVLYYGLVHMGQQGLIFVFLPALWLISAAALVYLARGHTRNLVVGIAALSLVHAAVFCLAPEYPLGTGSQRLLTRATLLNSDAYFQQRFDTIRAHFSPKQTAILAASWHYLDYYLPDYPRIPFDIGAKWEEDEGVPASGVTHAVSLTPADLGLHANANGEVTVVIFDPALEAFNRSPGRVSQSALPGGGALDTLTLRPGDRLYLDGTSFGVVDKSH